MEAIRRRAGLIGCMAWALSSIACDAPAPSQPPASPDAPPRSPDDPSPDPVETTAPNELAGPTEPPPRVDLSQATFLPVDSAANGSGVRVVLGVVPAPVDDDDRWSIADGLGAAVERTRIEVSTASLRKAQLRELGPLPKQLLLIGEQRTCLTSLPARARVENDGEGFELATVSVSVEDCGDPGTKQGWAPIALAGPQLSETLRYVPAERRLYVADGKVVRGEDELLTAIEGQDTAPPQYDDEDPHGPGVISGFVDEVPDVSPAVVAVFAGMVYPHTPPPPREPDPCAEWAAWNVTLGQRTTGPAVAAYPVHPNEPQAVDLIGAFTHQGHVQAVLAEVVLDLAVLVPGPFEPGDATEGFVAGRWVDISTGFHHDEDVAFSRIRLGDTCEP